ncbi:DNA-deoxyinosine glycosylase [Desulfitobacterium sp. Sab5]|uniref:DNA-deoxyinosine glycosylase n=1 Tax=Desulfitobacterium nosdiversum TaxID=3375356 RepID=UPI003CF712AB
MIVQGFKPVIDHHSHILILGSMPSEESLKRQEYYANSRNQFWRIMEILFDQDNRQDNKDELIEKEVLERSDYAQVNEHKEKYNYKSNRRQQLDISYAQKLEFVLRNQLALWDVIAACEREGSLDSNIKSPEPNRFAELFAQYPNIHYLAFNGQKAFDVYQRQVGLNLKEGLIYKALPSTSPANTMSLERKIEEWKILKDWINHTEK